MILLVGSSADPPLRAVAASLQQAGAQYICVDGILGLARPWASGCEAVLCRDGREISLDEVHSAYLRPFAVPTESGPEREALETLLAWADTAMARIVNRPAASTPNNSKPLQSKWIKAFGLRIPETLVTTDPASALEFVRLHGEVVYKSVSGVRSIVRRLGKDRFSQLDEVAHCPTQFQRYIPGDDLRVHVIGDAVRALQINSDRDDYRYAARDGGQVKASEIELEPALAQSLRILVRQMGLWVAGVDLRRTQTGEIYCLEVNPAPGFTYYENLAGVKLAQEIAALLLQRGSHEMADPR